ncbi:MAG: hypothetical protein R3E79_35235, partial [Caldilineaceae bacterium]
KLAEDAAAAADAGQRHRAYYLDFLQAREALLLGRQQRQALDELSHEFDNIRAAWQWALAQDDLAAIEPVIKVLYHFCEIGSRIYEGRELFEQAVVLLQSTADHAKTPVQRHIQHKLRAYLGNFCRVLGDWTVARTYLEQSLAVVSDTIESAMAFQALSHIQVNQGNLTQAKELMHQGLAISRRINNQHQIAWSLIKWANVFCNSGDFAQGCVYAEEAIEICRVLERPDLLGHALSTLAWPLNCLGEYHRSEAYWQECLTVGQATGNKWTVASARNFLGWAAWSIGGERLAEAQHYYEQALAGYRHVGEQQGLSMCLSDLALAFNEMGLYEAALAASREGMALGEMMANPIYLTYGLAGLGYASAQLGEWDAGRRRLHKAMRITLDTGLVPQLLLVLYHDLWLLVDTPVPMQPAHGVLALTALDLLVDHPKTWQPIRDRAQRLRAQLVSALPPKVVAAHAAQEVRPTLEALVAQLVGEEAGVV